MHPSFLSSVRLRRHARFAGPALFLLRRNRSGIYSPAADGDEPAAGWQFHPLQYLYFAVPDLEKTRDRVLAAGGAIDEDIAEMPWGERLFYARDPLGSRLCFVDEATLFTG